MPEYVNSDEVPEVQESEYDPETYDFKFFDQVSGSPCANCESEPQMFGSIYCSDECQAEFEGDEA